MSDRPRPGIAIVGIGCRFPGAAGPEGLWQLLAEGRDAIGEVPRERFDLEAVFDPRPGTPGKLYSRWGGFVADVDRFDADFFGISPREAARMDPQQRLLLECAAEALEDAGIPATAVAGSAAGVFVGLGSDDYRELGLADRFELELYTTTGGGRGVAAGRVSHAFDLRGPSLAVDSDRSASLVAVHLACRSLQSGECGLALAGGANLVLRPEPAIAFSQARMLAADGRCKPFAAAADGFVRSDGAAVVVLKPIERTLEDGDRVYAVIRGSAVGSDGGSSELLAPSEAGQRAVLEAAYRDAGIAPAEVDYVEAHGTGTPLGDLVETRALGSVLAAGRPGGRPCRIGSVKSNIGHTEAAAGIAGLVKVALSLDHRVIPASLHCEEPSRSIPWADLPLEVQRATTPWPAGRRPARAGVSSFGIAGTNAHVVMEEAPRPAAVEPEPRDHLLLLSARTPDGVARLAGSWVPYLRSQPERLEAACFTAARRRDHHPHRLAVAGASAESLAERLAAFAAGESRPQLVTGQASGEPPRVVLVFPGQGSQWLGMGRELAASEPVFAAALERCDAAIRDLAGWSPLDELAADEARSRLAEVDVVQPLLFALQVALAELWLSYGVEPAAVVGQSLGEVAAAYVAGALCLEDAASVIVNRSRVVKQTSGCGAMALVELPRHEAEELVAPLGGEVVVSGTTSPTFTMLSGHPEAVDRLLAALTERELFCRRIDVDYASHCPQMDPLLGELARALRGLAPLPCAVPMWSTVTAAPVDGGELDAGYWVQNLRRPVQLAEAVAALLGTGHDLFLEVSPHPVLVPSLKATVRHHGRTAAVVGTLKRGEPERETFLASLGALFASGYPVRMERLYPHGSCVSLPLYPWQRERHWRLPAGSAQPAAEPARPTVEAPAPQAPRGAATEQLPLISTLRRLAAGVLGFNPERLDEERPLTAMGLDSLLATELCHRIENELSARLPVVRLLSGATLGDLELEVSRLRVEAQPPGAPSAEPSGEAELPLSLGQKAMWFLHRMAPESAAYNLAFVFRVEGSLEVDALHTALGAAVERHPALRTTFHAARGEPFQRVQERLEPAFLAEDAGGWSAAQLDHRVQRDAFRPFDLSSGPLLRVSVFHRSPTEHVLVVAMHHIVTDLWSTAILFRDLGTLYAAAVAGTAAELEPLTVSHRDHVEWQRRLLAGPEGERLREYWTRQLAPPLGELDLPTDRPRPPIQTFRGASETTRLPEALSAGLHALAEQHGTTLYSVLLAAFQTLLERYTGQTDVVVGSPLAGRTSAAHAGLVGYLVNAVPLRGDLSGDPTFAELLVRTRARVLGAIEHQDFPFPLLVDAVQPSRDPSRSPLFQVLLALERVPWPEQACLTACAVGQPRVRMDLGGLSLESLRLEESASQLDLSLMFADVDGSLSASAQYNTDLFDAATIRRLLGHLRVLLESVVENPSRRLSELPLLTAPERRLLLADWNATAVEHGDQATVPELIAAQVARTPSAVAAVCDGVELTYRELDRRSSRVAARLAAAGVGPEVLVGLSARRDLDMLVGLLGVHKAGGAYVPLDPDLPPARAAFIQEDAGIAVLLTQRELVDKLPRTTATVLCLEDLVAETEALVEPPRPALHPENLAYVTYTSGSTGRPKGVQVTHRGVVNLLRSMATEPGLSTADTLLAVTTISFDISVLELFLPLATGAKVVLLPRANAADGTLLARAVEESGATVMQATPATWRMLVEAGWSGGDGLRALCGGEALPGELAAKLMSAATGLWNLYGPTETTVWSALHHLDAAPGTGVVPIGRPIANTTLYVLDAACEPVPVGVPGELYIGGAGLARGYRGRPELTAAAFVPDPFGTEPGARLYRTGDRVRRRADGAIEFLGRLDQQVKVHGFRIEPGEVEAVLLGHPTVLNAAVAVKEVAGDQRLVAYVVPRQTDGSGPGAGQASVSELRAFLKEQLPDHMVPSAFVVVDSLPLTASGKVDRLALPAPDAARPRLESVYAAPRTPVETTLVRTWAQVLGLERVGVHDNFFDLGGDSIRSIRIVALAAEHGLALGPKDIFQHQTIAELAALPDIERAIEPDQGQVTGPVAVAPTQRWLFEQPPREPWHFNQTVLLRLLRPVRPALLQRALEQLLRHHDALRLRIERVGERWQQVNAPFGAPLPFTRVDVSTLGERELGRAIEAAAAAEEASLDLSSGPLLRATLFDAGAQRASWLLLSVHQLAVDTHSWQVLLEDLDTAYTQIESSATVSLPAKSTSFLQWAGLVAGDDSFLAAQEPVVPAAPPLPVDFPGGGNTRASAQTLSVSLSVEESAHLRAEAILTKSPVRPRDVLLTALLRAFAPWTGSHRLTVELDASWRKLLDGVDLSRTVGCFASPTAVTLEIRGEDELEDLDAVTRQLEAAIPLEPGTVEPPAGFRPPPPGQAEVGVRLFALPGPWHSDLMQLAELSGGGEHGRQGSRRSLIEVVAHEVDDRLRFDWTFSRNLHREPTIASLADSFLQELRSVAFQALRRARQLAPGVTAVEPRRREPTREPARVSPAMTLAHEAMRGLPQQRLEILNATHPDVEDLYPLSPMQEGMLFHSLLEPEWGIYFEQLSWRVSSRLDPALLRRAVEELVHRHSILRTSFLWEDLDHPLQLVHRHVSVPWSEEDWREVPPAEREARLVRLAADDRRRGFDLTRAPLLRLCLVRLGDEGYRLLWSHHHLLLDGWSIELLHEELLDRYEALATGHRLEQEPARPYRDFIAWLERQDVGAAERFWRAELAGLEGPTPLPMQRRDSLRRDSRLRRIERRRLPATLTASLQAFAAHHRLTLSTLLQGAWALTLSLYSGNDDVVFGVTSSGRPASLTGADTMVGLLINTVPLRARLAPRQPLVAWLADLQRRHLEAREHEHTPLVRIAEWSGLPRETPLFDSILVFESYPLRAAAWAGRGQLELDDLRFTEETNYPLTLVAIPGGELLLEASFEPERFESGAISGLLRRLEVLLAGMVDHADQPLAALPLLAQEEQRLLLEEWNPPERESEAPEAAQLLVEQQVQRTPHAAAVIGEHETLTYAELNRRANRLARRLRAVGVGPEVVVAVCLERSVEAIVAVLAVLKAEGAFLPLDPAYPRERLELMLADAQAPVLVTTRSLSGRLDGSSLVQVLLDEEAEVRALAELDDSDLAGAEGGDRLAYVIFTSGSTGQPKGAMLQHSGLVNLMRAQQQLFRISAGDRVLQFAPLSFDASVAEIFSSLGAGAALVVVPADSLLPPEPLLATLRRHAVTMVTLPPSVLALLDEADLPALHTLVVAGEAASGPLVVRWAAGRRVVNAYGPTEATVCATGGDCLADGLPPPIGRPIPNVRAYVLDRHLRPLPVGAPGELCVGGVGVARGYLRRPTLTAERFVPDRFSRRAGARLYRTGDLARLRDDGAIELLGRSDQQLKVRGVRIEPGEVEATLERHPAVRTAAVVARERELGGGRTEPLLTAFVVAADADHAEQLDPTALRAVLARSLPEVMLPSAFVQLPALPLTPSGKVDRKALQTMDVHLVEPERATVPARTVVEQVLTDIFAEVLGCERVGIHDSFFALGGHSLMATQVMSRLRQAFGVELPIRTLFERPTVAGLAARVDQARSGGALPVPVGIPRAPRDGEVPLSPAQQRLWFLDRLEPGSSAYNIPFAVRLVGPLRADLLLRSLDAVVERHEVLRTRFEAVEGRPRQVILPAVDLRMGFANLTQVEEPARPAELARRIAAESTRPFDLATGPLVRATLFGLGEAEHVLLLVIHHIVADGWSMGVLLRELSACYRAFAAGEATSPLPELPVQYADFAVWQRSWLEGAVVDDQLAYWRGQLAGASELQLATDRPRPPMQTFTGAVHRLELDADLSAALRRLSLASGVSLYMTLLAGFMGLLGRITDSTDVVVGSPIANRNRGETEGLIGFFVNTLVLRGDLSGDPSFGELLGRVRDVALEADAHQDIPFERLVEELAPHRDLSRNPLFSVLFAFQNAPPARVTIPGLEITELELIPEVARFDLELHLWEAEGRLRGATLFNTDLYERPTVERLCAHLETFLRSAVERPDLPLSRLAVLTPAEERYLVEVLGRGEERPGGADVVLRLLAERVARHPDAVAVESDGARLTYAELERRARLLAGRLQPLGVGPDVPVAIAAERGVDAVVAVLGVLEAGGAYVPVDVHDPTERVAYLLGDCGAKVVLTQRRLVDRLQVGDARLLCLDEPAGEEVQPFSAPAVGPDHLAYVIYTSGSTGRPKGVAMRHGALANLVSWQVAQPGFDAPARTAHLASLSFDVSFQELFSTWCSGGTLVVVGGELRRDAVALARFLEESGVERLFAPPVALQQLAEVVLERGPVPRRLREVIVAGEQLRVTPELVSFFDALPGCRLVNQYGPSECHVVTACELSGPPSDWPALPAIGRPIANTRVHLLDRHFNPVPLGAVGELHIAGAALGRGYLSMPELTAAAFVADRFAQLPGARMYRTGDLARFAGDGNLQFLGRADQQVKVRGFRVEPGEVEAVLEEHPAVREAVVVARDQPGGRGRRLVAYLVPRSSADGAALSADSLRRWLKEKLPEHMIPSASVVLEALPLTPSGKVDRRSLPEPAAPIAAAPVAPRSPAEERMAAIFAEVLGLPQVGVDDDFFALGGHSLLAVRLMVLVEKAFGASLPLATLFREPTAAGLARLVSQPLPAAARSCLVPIQAGGGQTPLFCVHPGGGHVLCYSELSRHLGPDQPLYGLQSRGHDGSEPPLESVGEMADLYVEAILAARPQGPYRLLGWSLGGVIAVEVAGRLLDRGHEVRLLALLDTAAPAVFRLASNAELTSLSWFARDLGAADGASLAELGNGDEVWPRLAERLRGEVGAVEPQRLHDLYRLFRGNVLAVASHDPQRYPGPVTLLRPEERPLDAGGDVSLGWARLTGRLDVVTVPGDHFTMLREPNVGVLAERLRALLAR